MPEDPVAARSGFDAFVSYAWADDPEFRDALLAGLTGAGLRLWLDRKSMPNRGTTFGQEIRRAIESSTRLLLLAGPAALSSGYVTQEWGYADDLGLPVLPVVPVGCPDELPERRRYYHAVRARPPRPVPEVVDEVVRILTQPVIPLGPCYRVPGPPPHRQGRPELERRLADALGLDRQLPEDAGRAARGAALYGLPGAGKSTVAAGFARATRTRRTFRDGVVWLSCGESFQPLTGAREVLRLVAPGAKAPEGAADLAIDLAEGIGGKEVLVVLDDVRDPAVVAPFLGAVGPGGRVLLTTLDQAVATALGTVEIPVGQLDEAAARRMLASWAGGPLPESADAVLAACDGLPFALAVIGAMVANRTPWALVVEALESRRLDLVQATWFADYPHRSLLRVLAASYDALRADDPRAAECYLELAAFRPGATLSERVLVRLWSRPGRLAPLEAGLVLPVLERRLLVNRTGTADGVLLHRLHQDFVRLFAPDPVGLETALVTSYRAEKGTGPWSGLADDGYVFDHLVAHLAALDLDA